MDLAILKRELSDELVIVKDQDLIKPEFFEEANFDSVAFDKTSVFLGSLKKFYINRYNNADQKKDHLVKSMTDTPEKEREFEMFREGYHNEAITDLVKNISETHRIIEKDGKLIQKIYPIYKDPDPDHSIDFNAQFYMPTKHLLGQSIDTLYFNCGVIWSMTFVLAVLLYFDILRRIIDGIGNLSNPISLRRVN